MPSQTAIARPPGAARARSGHRLRLDVQPRDGAGSVHYTHDHADYNTATDTIHAGGGEPSCRLLPVIPARTT
jgi:hypothetical protein